ncbi:MAG: alpha/beta hydrolase-fold protein [Chitinophagaceae bacterium]
MKRILFSTIMLFSLKCTFAQTPASFRPDSAYIPVEVNTDSSAVFRFYAPNAKSVTLGGDLKAAKTERDNNGVWTMRTGPGIFPSAYRYFFMVDGVKVNDPKNPMTADFRPIVELVPGRDTLFWQQKKVPHGAMSIMHYESKSTASTRRMFVWTPPGYFAGTEKLPVLYLVHGGGDNDTNWPGQGKAGWILDNLFNEGKIVPMVVVMPDGSIPVPLFAKDMGNDIIPFVEANFRVHKNPENRAMAGLSMGGLETLETLLAYPSLFRYAGVWGSGWHSHVAGNYERYEKLVKEAAPQLRKSLQYFSFMTGGSSDIADKNNDLTVAVFDKYNVKSTVAKTEGGHTMYAWKLHLLDFAPRLFR